MVLSTHRVGEDSDIADETGMDEASVVETFGATSAPASPLGKAEEGRAIEREVHCEPGKRGGSPVCGGQCSDCPVRNEIYGCVEDSSRGRCHRPAGGDHGQGDAGEEHSEEKTSEMAVVCSSPEVDCACGSLPPGGSAVMPSDLRDVSAVPELCEAEAGLTVLNILHSKDGAEPNGRASVDDKAVNEGNAPSFSRPVAMVSRSAVAGRVGHPDASHSVAPRHVRPIIPRDLAIYDPADLISRLTSQYSCYPFAKSCEGILDRVDPSLVGAVRLPGGLPPASPIGRAVKILTDPEALRDIVQKRQPPHFVASARSHMRFVSELCEAGLSAKRSRSSMERGFAKFFTIEKKRDESGTPILRTILDCRDANDCFSDPLPVNLPTLPAMLEAFRSVEEMRTLDLRHWYHQIPISTELSQWFTVAFGSLRLQWQVLPMGWKWACFIAQAISTFAAAGDLALEWTELPPLFSVKGVTFAVVYDNIIAGGPRDAMEEAWLQLRARLDSLNAVVKEEFQAVSGKSLPALGIEWRPSPDGLAWCLLEKFTSKAAMLAGVPGHQTSKNDSRCPRSCRLVEVRITYGPAGFTRVLPASLATGCCRGMGCVGRLFLLSGLTGCTLCHPPDRLAACFHCFIGGSYLH
eukprot:PhM_4_TR2766/c0_g1_i1/m.89226